jgi:hypothetical protein
MISFDDLGNLGRLGNQMFQYASLRGIASKHGYDYCIPPRDVFGVRDKKVKNSDITIFECFQIPEIEKMITNFPKIMEPPNKFDENIWNTCPDNINLFGYYQFEKYFQHIKDDIKKAFTFVDDIFEPCKKFFSENFQDREVISLHVRRTDYLNQPDYHPVQGIEYYQKSLEHFSKDIPVLIFSDDIAWCKSQDIFSDDRFLFSEDNNTGVDLCLQSLCTYHIIANSSFSWWGAWLANSKQIIAPSNWFGGQNVMDMEFGNWSWL